MNPRKKEWLDAWHVNASANREYDLIDGLRGIAILMVLACHLFYINPSSGQVVHFIRGILAAGSSGVAVFFTLSGFLISWPFWKRKISGKAQGILSAKAQVIPSGYGWRRFWKVYPPLALSVIFFAAVSFLTSRDSSYVTVALQWLAGWPIVHPVSNQINPVMWSLIVEVQFYIVLPLLFVCLKRFSAKATLWTVFVVFGVVPITWRWLGRLPGVYGPHGVLFTLEPVIDVHFPGPLDAFLLGVMVAGLENMGLIKKSWAKLGDLGFVLLATALVGTALVGAKGEYENRFLMEIVGWTVKLASAFLLCYIGDAQHPRARLLSQPWLRWCGIISYEWYLFHQPFIEWARSWFGHARGDIFKYGLINFVPLIIGVIVAAGVYRWFSLPILRYGRSRNESEKVKEKQESPVSSPSVSPGRPSKVGGS
jgi:peptidoglycan/LPS O-acetylase OafA/YrhL